MRFPDVTPDIGVPGPIRSALRAAGRVRVPSVAGTYSPRGSWSGPGRSRETVGQAVRDPDTWVNLAATFMPGPPGGKGRFIGALTPAQKRFMNQLRGIVDYQQIPGPPPGGTVPYPEPIWEKLGPNAMRQSQSINTDPTVRQIADRLGYTQGDPLTDLWNIVHRQGGTLGELQSKLGTFPDRPPNWLYPKKMQELFKPKGDLPDRVLLRGMGEEMSNDQLQTLAKIIETINRRGPMPRRVDLGEYGGN